MKTKLLGAVAVLSALGFAAPASAMLVSVTYWGTVNYGLDVTGVFGLANTRLDGDSYMARYVYDTTLGNASNSSTEIHAFGGTVFGFVSPLVSASVTINGHSVNIGGGYDDESFGRRYEGFSAHSDIAIYRTDLLTARSSGNEIYNYGDAIPFSLTGPFTYDVDLAAGDYTSGGFSIASFNTTTGIYDALANGGADLTRLTVGPVESVPEPSTWAMMLAGLAGLAFAGYRRARLAA